MLESAAGVGSTVSLGDEVQRRYRELVERTVKPIPGHLVFRRLRARLGG